MDVQEVGWFEDMESEERSRLNYQFGYITPKVREAYTKIKKEGYDAIDEIKEQMMEDIKTKTSY